jgi:hypothetical protein
MLGAPHRLSAAYSCRPRPWDHCAGHLGIGWGKSLAQAACMTIVVALKLTFEYYVVCEPMVEPVCRLSGH